MFEDYVSIHSEYRSCVKAIVMAAKESQDYIPIGDLMKRLEVDGFPDKFTKSERYLISEMKYELYELATLCGYTVSDGQSSECLLKSVPV